MMQNNRNPNQTRLRTTPMKTKINKNAGYGKSYVQPYGYSRGASKLSTSKPKTSSKKKNRFSVYQPSIKRTFKKNSSTYKNPSRYPTNIKKRSELSKRKKSIIDESKVPYYCRNKMTCKRDVVEYETETYKHVLCERKVSITD